MFDTYEVLFEIYIREQCVQRQTMQAPREVIIMNFLQLADQIRNDPRPIQIKMIRKVFVWDQFEQSQKIINNEIVLTNAAMTTSEKE